MGSSYLLTSAIFQPFIVALSDEFGRRSALFLCAVLFTLGTLIGGLSMEFPQLLAGRTIQGVGGGGILALNNVIISDIVPLDQRPLYLAVPQLSWAVGTITGPLFGGLFVQHSTWRWAFYINFPFCAVGLAIIPWTARSPAQSLAQRGRPSDRLRRMDWAGMSLFTMGTTLLLAALTWGGVEYAWSSWQTLVPGVLGAVVLPLTILYERFVACRPFLRLSLFGSLSANAAYFCSLILGLLVRTSQDLA